ncbi:RNA-binding KH domain-containing protein PEPPER-like isoform X2 [Panicum virgatum]|uniref:RNA-binding KH domain-containing protein PEPPER-like isoform X2 n=1 Tax=Panicum virgatum TaxID=38727 RepID=UPI0019D5E0DE|nr:RNA-binding KH domain-containing protein PEPPER-like isoform X2 [Panicum virgatum]
MAPPPEDEEAAIDAILEAGVDDEEEEDPEEVEPWIPSSDSEPDEDRPALEPPDPSPAAAEAALQPARMAVKEEKGEGEEARPRWPGWPGASVFRLLVPADKVGGLIGRCGSTIKRLCDETRARVRVIDAAHAAADRIALVSATEEVEAELSPAMNAAIKIFKHINGIEEINSDGTLSASAPEICSVRLLVPAAQAVHLIGTQGVTIKSIQESTGATIRIIDEDELLSEVLDERIVKIYGASLKVHNALKSVLGLLRKFLVDHGVLHLFERKNQEVAQAQHTLKENQFIDTYHVAVNQDFWLSDQRGFGPPIGSRPLCGHDPSFCDPYSSDVIHATDSLMTQTMKIPLPYAEEIIGERGENIEFVRSVSGAVVILEEIGDYPEEVLIVIKGSPSQVQTAHQLLQEVLSGNREPPPLPPRICFRGAEAGPRVPSSPHAGAMLLNSPPTTCHCNKPGALRR